MPRAHTARIRCSAPGSAALVAGALLALAASGSGVAAVAGHDIHVNATGSLTTEQNGSWNILHSTLVLAVVASWLVWLAVQVPRYRRVAGERRQQLKWLYSGAVALVVSVFAGALASGSSSDLAEVISNLIVPLGFAAFAACFAVAVLRYRLYEIDRIISGEIWWAWSMKRSSPPTSRYGSPARLTGEQPPLTRREPEPRLTRP